jgi:hypothetical protein
LIIVSGRLSQGVEFLHFPQKWGLNDRILLTDFVNVQMLCCAESSVTETFVMYASFQIICALCLWSLYKAV